MDITTIWLVLIACVTGVAAPALYAGAFEVRCEPSVTAEVGDTVTLPCLTEPQRNVSDKRVEWLRGNDEVHLFLDGKDNFLHQMSAYQGRTSISHDDLPKGNCSLTLSNVQESDSGPYQCSVKIKAKRKCITHLNILPPGKKTSHSDQPQDPPISSTEKPAGLHEGNTTSNGTNPTEEKDLSQTLIAVLVPIGILLIFVGGVIWKYKQSICALFRRQRTENQQINRNVPEGVPLKTMPPHST